MTAEHFTFDLITPEKIVFSGPVGMVEVPGEMGDFGVLPGHAPFLSAVRPGAVTIHADAATTRLFVAGGMAEVTPERCTLLASVVEDITALTRPQAESRLSQARAALAEAVGDAARAQAESEVTIAEAMLHSIA